MGSVIVGTMADEVSEDDGPWVFDGRVGEHLQRLRELRADVAADGTLTMWTNGELAERAGCTKDYVRQVIIGAVNNPSMKQLAGFCEALDVPPNYFFSERVRRRVNTRLSARLDALRAEQARRAQGEQ